MKVGDYVRTKNGYIYKIENGTEFYEDSVDVGIGVIPDVDGIWVDEAHFQYVDKREIIKSSPNIIDLIEVGDLLFIDISPDDYGGIVVPRTTETENELQKYLNRINSGECILKGILTKEQIENGVYWVNE